MYQNESILRLYNKAMNVVFRPIVYDQQVILTYWDRIILQLL